MLYYLKLRMIKNILILFLLLSFLTGCSLFKEPIVTNIEPVTTVKVDSEKLIISSPTWWVKSNGLWTMVTFTEPYTEDSDTFKENINVISQDLSKKPMDLEEYITLSKSSIWKFFKNSKIWEGDYVTINWKKAYRIIYSGIFNWKNLKWLQIWEVTDDKQLAHVLTLTTEENEFDRLKDVADNIFKSTTFEKNQ